MLYFKINTLVSVIWLIVVYVVGLEEFGKALTEFFLVFGVLPTVILWGVYWLKRKEPVVITGAGYIGLAILVGSLLIAGSYKVGHDTGKSYKSYSSGYHDRTSRRFSRR